MEKLIMTAGPTNIKENVRNAMAKSITNPDLDLDFYEFYYGICEKVKRVLKTKNEILILNGEGILGLESACVSLLEEGDKVLCIENGIFGYFFGDFAKLQGAKVDYLSLDRSRGLSFEEISEYLKENNNYKIATVVQCETPCGITNDVESICKLLDEYNIISIVDVVSSAGGEELNVDEWKIDIALGGSQKCLSSPPGLSFLSISEKAKKAMKNRKTEIKSYYANLLLWDDWYEKKWFPYTQPISNLYAFDTALDNFLEDENAINRHKTLAKSFREAIMSAGLKLYCSDCYSNTVSSILIPENISYKDVFNKMKDEHNIIIGGGFDFLANKIIRIGHMGENCHEDKIYLTLKALDKVFEDLNVELKCSLHKAFIDSLE